MCPVLLAWTISKQMTIAMLSYRSYFRCLWYMSCQGGHISTPFFRYQSLVNVTTLRNYFLREENYLKIKVIPGDIMINLVKRFGELTRKLWNPRNFKAHVSPHEMLQAVVKCSKKKFQITNQGKIAWQKYLSYHKSINLILFFWGDPIEFLSWLLNSLHITLNGTKSPNSSIIYKTFQGNMKIYTRKILPLDLVNSLWLWWRELCAE